MSAPLAVQTQVLIKPTITPVMSRVLQRCTATTECDECRKKRESTLQRVAVNTSPVNDIPPIVQHVLHSPGQPLDGATRTFMEPRFGYDFSNVRVHTDANAAESARSVNALAYTVGRDVVFGAGQYRPFEKPGQHLLAHELSHVVQQRNLTTAGTIQPALLDTINDDRFEHEAQSASEQVSKGGQPQGLSTIPQGGLQRQALTDVVETAARGAGRGAAGGLRSSPVTGTTVTPTHHRFRAASVSFLSCAPCNVFTDDGTLGITPPTTEPPATSSFRQMHHIEAELDSADGRTIMPGSERVTSGETVGISHYCGSAMRAHIVDRTRPAAPKRITSVAGIEGIELESEMHSRVGADVPPTLIGSPCGFLGTNPKIPFIGNRFKLRLFADGTKESAYVSATLYPTQVLYEDGGLKMFGGSPVHPRIDFFDWATSTGVPLKLGMIGFYALRMACCDPKFSHNQCGTICIGDVSMPDPSFLYDPRKFAKHTAYAAALWINGCPPACAPAGAGCSSPIVKPSNP